MNPDCPQCAEWELCPFHPKEERAPEPAHDDEWCIGGDVVVLQVSGETTIHGISPKRTVVRLSSDCGEYVRTYQDGKLVDEEPAEAYKDHTIEAMVQSYKGIVSNAQLLVVTPKGVEPYRGCDSIDSTWVFWP